jgi:D-glycero-alpha-D-manno-heptose-7-phosphate kinase
MIRGVVPPGQEFLLLFGNIIRRFLMIVVQTPLRISFAGGGTDFEDYYLEHGGAVLSSAIDKYVFVIVKERFDNQIYLNYSRKEIVDHPWEIKHDLVREALKTTGVEKGIEITTLADIPSEGTGLGSSSSITVGLLNALQAYKGESAGSEYLAREACRIEIDIIGSPIGRQDQYIAAYGGLRLISFNRDGVKAERIVLPSLNQRRLCENLLLFYSDITRKSGEILTEQKANISEHLEILAQMAKQAYEARDALLAGEYDAFGEVIHRGWELKKQLASRVSSSQIDDILNSAIRAGAIGGKVTGAGGGGFILLYCRREKRDDVRAALHGLRELPLFLEYDGSKVILNYRRAQ